MKSEYYNYCRNGAFRTAFTRIQGGGLAEEEFDEGVALELSRFFKHNTIVDFGAGIGRYTEYLQNKGLSCQAFDGTRKIELLTNGLVKHLDLSKKVSLPEIFDWILCLEVGEHIPAKYQANFVENLHNHNRKGIVISWALPGQDGTGHVNCKTNGQVTRIFTELGYGRNRPMETILRSKAEKAWWLKESLFVLQKNA